MCFGSPCDPHAKVLSKDTANPPLCTPRARNRARSCQCRGQVAEARAAGGPPQTPCSLSCLRPAIQNTTAPSVNLPKMTLSCYQSPGRNQRRELRTTVWFWLSALRSHSSEATFQLPSIPSPDLFNDPTFSGKPLHTLAAIKKGQRHSHFTDRHVGPWRSVGWVARMLM